MTLPVTDRSSATVEFHWPPVLTVMSDSILVPVVVVMLSDPAMVLKPVTEKSPVGIFIVAPLLTLRVPPMEPSKLVVPAVTEKLLVTVYVPELQLNVPLVITLSTVMLGAIVPDAVHVPLLVTVMPPGNVLVPNAELIVRVPEIVDIPVTSMVSLPIVTFPPTGTVKAPATFNTPVLLPVKAPVPSKIRPPAPTLVINPMVVQLAVPKTVSERHEPGFPFMVTVFPAQIITLSPAPGIVREATPPQATVDHVAGVFQPPATLE